MLEKNEKYLKKVGFVIVPEVREEVKLALTAYLTAEVMDLYYCDWYDNVFEAECQCNYFEFKKRLYQTSFETEVSEIQTVLGYPLSLNEKHYLKKLFALKIDHFVQEEAKANHGDAVEVQKTLLNELRQAKGKLLRVEQKNKSNIKI